VCSNARGGRARWCSLECQADAVEGGGKILADEIGFEPQHFVARAGELEVTVCEVTVCVEMATLGVVAAVYFDDEVGEVGAMLAGAQSDEGRAGRATVQG